MTTLLTASNGQLHLDGQPTGIEYNDRITAATDSDDVAALVDHLIDFRFVDHDGDTIFLSDGIDD